jgi:ribosomal-protein-alanine N-acetyltransferase
MNVRSGDLLIRRMSPEDVPVVHEIDTLSFSLPWPERSFRFEVNDNPAARAWVAELDGRVVAMLVLWLVIDEAHIATLATHPEFRQRGAARRLLVEALVSAREEGARLAFLEVRTGNLVAQAMYRKYGFEVAGVRRRYYKDNDEDALLMTLEGLEGLETK